MKIRNKSLRTKFLGDLMVYSRQEIEVEDSMLGEIKGFDWVEILEEPKKVERKKTKKKITTKKSMEELEDGII